MGVVLVGALGVILVGMMDMLAGVLAGVLVATKPGKSLVSTPRSIC